MYWEFYKAEISTSATKEKIKILKLNIKHSFQYLYFIIQYRIMENCLFIEYWGKLTFLKSDQNWYFKI